MHYYNENLRKHYISIESSLSFEERQEVKESISNKNCLNCCNGSCRVETFEKYGIDEFGNVEGSLCIGWDNPELIGRQKVLIMNKHI